MLPERIRLLDVDVNGVPSGRLAHATRASPARLC